MSSRASHIVGVFVAIICAVTCATLVFAACGDYEVPAPRIDAVSPDTIENGEVSTLTLTGEFHVQVRVSTVPGRTSEIDAQFDARLGTRRLDRLTYVDATTLTAVVPADVEIGVYDLSVTDPGGRTATLAGALSVEAPSD